MSHQIQDKPLLGSSRLCDNLLRRLANGADLKTVKCKELFTEDHIVAAELSRAGCTVANSKCWWGRFREKARPVIEKAISGIPAERIRRAAAMANGNGNGGGANPNA